MLALFVPSQSIVVGSFLDEKSKTALRRVLLLLTGKTHQRKRLSAANAIRFESSGQHHGHAPCILMLL